MTPSYFDVQSLNVRLPVRVSARARRLSLRVDPARGVLEVVVPVGVGEGEVARFVGRHLSWVKGRLATLPPRLPFVPGLTVPIQGEGHVIRHDPSWRGPVSHGHGELWVGGGLEFLNRRVRDHLKHEALRVLAGRTTAMAGRVGRRVSKVSVRDPRSRWGSCAADGRISYSWRLILAPESVLTYVVAHEVAHLVEMNHSPQFWACVGGLVTQVQRSRDWLKANGTDLLRYG